MPPKEMKVVKEDWREMNETEKRKKSGRLVKIYLK
jgi:hypothetical protein